MSTSPPPSRGMYATLPPPEPVQPAPAAPVEAPPVVATGVLRIDGPMTRCEAIAALPDGGATLLCSLEHEDACVLRTLGPDGEVRRATDPVPGICAKWAPRPDGGGFLATTSSELKVATFTNLDANGHRIARGSMTSKEGIYINDLRIAEDGFPVVALEFRQNLVFRGKQLGTTKFSTSALLKLNPVLDRLTWSNIFSSRRTYISALLPATRSGIDAVINTRGPLVEGGPVNPPIDPKDGSVFGGDSYGWTAERVAFDRKGADVARLRVAPERTSAIDATQIDTATAVMTRPDTRMLLTLTRAADDRETVQLGLVPSWRFSDDSGEPWVVECDCTYDKKTYALVGPWYARELSGSKRKIELKVPTGAKASWTSVAVRDDVIVALGTGTDATTKMPISLTALARVPAGAALDAGALRTIDKLELAPGCRDKPRTPLFTLVAPDHLAPFDAQLAACGVAPNARVSLYTHLEGGLRKFTIEKTSPKVIACAREILEPQFVCPTDGNNVTFSVLIKRP